MRSQACRAPEMSGHSTQAGGAAAHRRLPQRMCAVAAASQSARPLHLPPANLCCGVRCLHLRDWLSSGSMKWVSRWQQRLRGVAGDAARLPVWVP